MKKEDLFYLCKMIGSLMGEPIRLYEDDREIFFHSLVNLVKDPIKPYEKEILKINEHISYFIASNFFYYGVLNFNNYKIIIGPSIQKEMTDKELKELAFETDVPIEEIDTYIYSLKNLVSIPLPSLLQILCVINFALNNEKLSIYDLSIYDDEQLKLSKQIEKEKIDYNEDKYINRCINKIHNTLDVEYKLLSYIRHGDVEALNNWIKNAPAVTPGILSNDSIRQAKNRFIVTTTLISREAIRSGIEPNEALSYSDAYIQKCELLNSLENITNLQFHMILDYATRIKRLRLGDNPSKLVIDIANYVQKHISEPIEINKLAKEIYLNRTYLATKFKKETNKTLTEYILNEKIEESKRFLIYSDKSLSSIANYLGFSSQSHYTNVFKKITKISPNEYRIKYKK